KFRLDLLQHRGRRDGRRDELRLAAVLENVERETGGVVDQRLLRRVAAQRIDVMGERGDALAILDRGQLQFTTRIHRQLLAQQLHADDVRMFDLDVVRKLAGV